MKVSMISMLTGETNVRELDVTQEDLIAFWEGAKGLVQEAFPQLSDDDREFIMTGISPNEWATYIIENDDESVDPPMSCCGAESGSHTTDCPWVASKGPLS